MDDDDFDVDEKVNEKMFDSVSIKFCRGQSMIRARQDCTGLHYDKPHFLYTVFITGYADCIN